MDAKDQVVTPIHMILRRGHLSAAMPSGNPNAADPASSTVVLRQARQFTSHFGGQLAFGPDGYLWIAMGDGDAAGDPSLNAQDGQTFLGKLLRIDVSNLNPYAIPADNPFVGDSNFLPEIWSYGLRNPWRFSFDRATGELWAGDVGWETWEMVDRIERGGNYGWSITEGPGPVHPDGKRGPTPIAARRSGSRGSRSMRIRLTPANRRAATCGANGSCWNTSAPATPAAA